MKIKFVLIVMLLVVIYSCSTEERPYTCSSCSDEPEALVANDNSGKGIYKGIVVGSSGTIIINMDNASDGDITGVLMVDGEEIQLTTEGTYSTGFDAYFYGTMSTSNDVQIGFLVNAIGNYIVVDNVIIPGHPNAEIQVVKERSAQLIEIFEGKLKGDNAGIINFIVSRNDDGDGEWSAIARFDGNINLEGYLEGSNFFGGGGEILITGAIGGDLIAGEWEIVGGNSGTWKGKRTL